MNVLLKKGICFLPAFVLVCLLTACFGDDKYEEYPMTDAEILTFSMSSDSVTELNSVVFSIDQRNGLIYNKDSMSFNTVFEYKVIVNYQNAYGTNNLLNTTNGDSTWVSSGDSLDISTAPLTLKSFSYGGNHSKEYILKVNIHQIDPDSMQYIRIASGLSFLETEETKTIFFHDTFYTFSKISGEIQLYRSKDAVNWERIALFGLPYNTLVEGIQQSSNRLLASTENGDLYICFDDSANDWQKITTPYPVVGVLGYLDVGKEASAVQQAGLCLIFNKDGENVFAFTPDLMEWNTGDIIPANFPVTDFSAFSQERAKIGRLTLIAGKSATNEFLNTVWSTQNGLYWAKLTNTDKIFPPMIKANVFYYDNAFWIMNGLVVDVDYNRDIYYSIDGGTTWTVKDEKVTRPDDFIDRWGASVVSDGVYFYAIGGRQADFLPEIWKCFINKMEFPE
jgi:hypothetical protein